jgi:hypothetical protein
MDLEVPVGPAMDLVDDVVLIIFALLKRADLAACSLVSKYSPFLLALDMN